MAGVGPLYLPVIAAPMPSGVEHRVYDMRQQLARS